MKALAQFALVLLVAIFAASHPVSADQGLPMGAYKRMLQIEKFEQIATFYASGMLEAYQMMYVAELINAGLTAEAAAVATNKCVQRYSPKSWAIHLTTRFHDDDDAVAAIALAAFVECVDEESPMGSDR